MIGVTVSSITAGRLTTRTGRYKIWPLVGLGVATVGVTLLSRLTADTPASTSRRRCSCWASGSA